MAMLFLWQFGGMVVKEVVGRSPLTAFWVGSHTSVGMLLLALVLLRAIWGIAQSRTRPSYHPGLIGALARLGHLALYVLMLVVPSLALLRAFGGDKPIMFFGLQLRGPTSAEVEWMTAPANALHGTLAWLLLALVAGHILMALVHRYMWNDDLIGRMIGAPAASRHT